MTDTASTELPDPTQVSYSSDHNAAVADHRDQRITETAAAIINAQIAVARLEAAQAYEELIPEVTRAGTLSSLAAHAASQGGTVPRLQRRLDRIRLDSTMTDETLTSYRKTMIDQWRTGVEREHAVAVSVLQEAKAEEPELTEEDRPSFDKLIESLQTNVVMLFIALKAADALEV